MFLALCILLVFAMGYSLQSCADWYVSQRLQLARYFSSRMDVVESLLQIKDLQWVFPGNDHRKSHLRAWT